MAVKENIITIGWGWGVWRDCTMCEKKNGKGRMMEQKNWHGLCKNGG